MSDLSEQAELLRQMQARLQHLEDAQRRQAMAHQAVLDALPAHLAVLDAQGVIVAVNQAWQHYAAANGGQGPDFGVGQNYPLLCDEVVGAEAEEAAQAARCVRAVLRRPGVQRSLEYPCHAPTGQRWFRMTATGLAADPGDESSGGAVVMHVDISERRLAEQERERERVLMRTLIDAMPDAVYTMDAAARGVICNPAAVRAFGVPGVDDLVGKTSLEVFAPEEAALRHAEDLQVLAGHAVVRREVPGSDHRGRPVWTEVTKLPLRDRQGEVVGLLGIHRDITERQQVEWTLRQHQALFGMVMRLGRIGAWAVDLAQDLVLWSDEVCAIHEVPAGTMPSFEQAVAYYPPEWAGIVGAAATACARQGTPFDLEAEIITARGRRIWVRVIGEAVAGDSGDIRRIQGAFQDLSERKQAEQARDEMSRRSEQRERMFGKMLAALDDFAYAFDGDGRFLFANQPLLDLWGITFEQALGKNFHELGYPADLAATLQRQVRQVFDTRASLTDETRYTSPSGQHGVYEYIFSPALGADGSVEFVVGTTRDISERKRAQEVAERTLQRMNDAQRIGQIGDWEFDLGTQAIFWSSQVFEIVGRDPRLGPPADYAEMLAFYDPASQALLEQKLGLAISSGRTQDYELRGRRPDGERVHVHAVAVPIKNAGGEVCRVYGTVQNITERKRDREALSALNAELEARVAARTAEANRARVEAEQANRAKSAFLATMSHEIRTPMNGVMGMIDVLHQTSLKGYQVEMVDLIRDSADTLLAIIDDILDFSKIEAGKLHIEQEPMQLADAVEKVCAMLDHTAVKRGVRMTVFVDPAIPRVVAGDETRVRQVLVNLCSNAIKFSSGLDRAGEISVRLTLLAQDAQGVTIDLAVADNGIGMDEAALARLFRPFSQADGSTTRRFGGTGLGLAITQTLVRLMGGEVTVRSAPAAGSTFSVRLRLARVADVLNDEPVAPAAGLNCRIVGGEQPLAHDLGAYLAHAGAEVEQVADLAAAAAAPAPAGLCVWLILPGQDVPDLAALRAMAPADDGHDSAARTRFVVLGRGARRRLRVEAADLVRLDADAMFRDTLIKALSLAVGRVQKAPVSDAAEPAHALVQAPPRHEARAQGRLILVAEDNETNRLVIARQLALIGYAADVVENGGEALEHWRSGDYALLLTDLHMPGMDGYALAAAIRAEESAEAGAPRRPILALTANALNDEERRCRAAGMDAYLTKPIRLAQLRQAIEGWLAPLAEGTAAPVAQPEPGSHEPAVDLKALAALVGDDPLVLNGVLKAFRAGAEQLGDELRRATTAGSPQALAAVAHKMKSGARAIGAGRLGDVCAAIEQADGEQVVNTLLPRLRGELQDVLDFLNREGGSP
jgi:PAS domain S-box-containing protein